MGDGWVQFSWDGAGPLKKVGSFSRVKKWPIAYHGTDGANVSSILTHGLRLPGSLLGGEINASSASSSHLAEEAVTPVRTHMAHGAACGRGIYVTPSLWLAAHPVYSPIYSAGNRYIQLVFKLRVRPDSYSIHGNTLGSGHFDIGVMIDPNFPTGPPEWVVSRSIDCVVVGLMMRELGPSVDVALYGSLVKKVSLLGEECSETKDASYQWTTLLSQTLHAGGYLRDRGQISSDPMTGHVKWQLSFWELQEDPGGGKPLNQFVSPAFAVPPLDGIRFYCFVQRYQIPDTSGFAPGSDMTTPFCVVVRTPPNIKAKLAWNLKPSDEYTISEQQWDRKARKFKKRSQILLSGSHNGYAEFSVEPSVMESGTFAIDVIMQYVVMGTVKDPLRFCDYDGDLFEEKSREGHTIHEWAMHRIWSLEDPWQVSQDYLCGSSVSSPAFFFRGKRILQQLELYPNGKLYNEDDSANCSLYLWTGGCAPPSCWLSIGDVSRRLDKTNKTLTPFGECYGFDKFCSTALLLECDKLNISIKHDIVESWTQRKKQRC